MPPLKAKTRRQTASFFSALLFASAATFALLLLLAVALPQTSPRTPIVLLLAGGASALGVIGVLLLVLGVPAYNHVGDLDDRCQNLEDQYPNLDHRNQILEIRCRSLEDRNQKLEDRYQKLEERLKAIELQDQSQNGLLEQQFPAQRKLAFMEIWSVQKRDHDTDLIRQPKAEVGRLAGSQR
jgi:hypothetical protein